MRWLLVLLASGCVDHDPCAGRDGTCIGLRVNGQGSVDQLQIQLRGAAQLDGITPERVGAPHQLPVTTALFLPAVGGAVDLMVDGLLSGTVVGQGAATTLVRPGLHQNLEVTLLPPVVGRDLATDMPAATDLAAADFSSEPDLSPLPDLSLEPDLRQLPDLTGLNPRYVFLLTARGPILGTHAALDNDCTVDATAAGLPAVAYKAIIAYPPSDGPDSYISLTAHRSILKPDGTQVSDDDNFFDAIVDHLAAIDQLADGTGVGSGCAFTNFSRTGFRINSPSDCVGWSDNTSANFGTVGDITATDSHWTFDATTPIAACNTLTCHVYCIQQD